jgi:hypothetical protein
VTRTLKTSAAISRETGGREKESLMGSGPRVPGGVQ